MLHAPQLFDAAFLLMMLSLQFFPVVRVFMWGRTAGMGAPMPLDSCELLHGGKPVAGPAFVFTLRRRRAALFEGKSSKGWLMPSPSGGGTGHCPRSAPRVPFWCQSVIGRDRRASYAKEIYGQSCRQLDVFLPITLHGLDACRSFGCQVAITSWVRRSLSLDLLMHTLVERHCHPSRTVLVHLRLIASKS